MMNENEVQLTDWLTKMFDMVFNGTPHSVVVIAECEEGEYFLTWGTNLHDIERAQCLLNRKIIEEMHRRIAEEQGTQEEE